ncbi:MAG: RusA family crossover junction endodeoxyribonuclease [Nodosilinea sp.]
MDGPPVSQQVRRRDRLRDWQTTVRQEAGKYWHLRQQPTSGLVMLQIIYFYNINMDVDNIAKPIQDALIGLVYIDNRQVIDILVSKRNLFGNLKMNDGSAILTEGFTRENDFLYIAVASASEEEIPSLW